MLLTTTIHRAIRSAEMPDERGCAGAVRLPRGAKMGLKIDDLRFTPLSSSTSSKEGPS